MKVNRSKKTKRFKFTVNRNTVSHQAGANTLTISTTDQFDSQTPRGYTTKTGTFSNGDYLTMTVKEAKALRGFLNSQFSD